MGYVGVSACHIARAHGAIQTHVYGAIQPHWCDNNCCVYYFTHNWTFCNVSILILIPFSNYSGQLWTWNYFLYSFLLQSNRFLFPTNESFMKCYLVNILCHFDSHKKNLSTRKKMCNFSLTISPVCTDMLIFYNKKTFISQKSFFSPINMCNVTSETTFKHFLFLQN